MGEITTTLSYPYHGGAATASLGGNFGNSVVGVAGRPYLLDTTGGRYNRRGVTVVQQRNTSDQRDILLLPQDIWRQSSESWHLGKGQSNQDRNDSLAFRYSDSFGVDPWTKYEFTLLPQTEQLGGSATVYAGDVWLTTHTDYLIVVNDDTLYRYDTLSTTATASAIVPSAGNTIIDVADDGHIVTTVHADGKIYKTSDPSWTPALWKTEANTTFIDWVKDYLIIGKANVLKDATKSSSPTTIYTHPDTAFRWVDATDGNQAIYVLGGIGQRWEIHKITLKDDGTGLNPAIVAARLPDGEVGYSIGRYLDFVFVGTNKGVRMATMQDNGDLTLGPILPTEKPVRCFEGQDRFVWFGISDMIQPYASLGTETYPSASAVCGLGRMDLSQFTVSALTPAFANDLFAANETGHETTGVVTYQDKRVFAVSDGSVYFETADKVPSGWLTQGVISFSIEDPKSALYQQLKWNPECAGRAMIDIAFDSTAFGRYANLQVTPTSIRSDNLNFNGINFSRADIRFVLNRCPIDETKAPRISRWEFRASPIKGKASRWELPIMNYDEVEIDGVTYTRDVLVELDFLINLVESGTVFIYQESGRSYQVHARDFVWQPEKLSANGNGWQGMFTMVVEEVL